MIHYDQLINKHVTYTFCARTTDQNWTSCHTTTWASKELRWTQVKYLLNGGKLYWFPLCFSVFEEPSTLIYSNIKVRWEQLQCGPVWPFSVELNPMSYVTIWQWKDISLEVNSRLTVITATRINTKKVEKVLVDFLILNHVASWGCSWLKDPNMWWWFQLKMTEIVMFTTKVWLNLCGLQ